MKWQIKSKLPAQTENRIEAIIHILLKNRHLADKKAHDQFFNPISPKDLTYKDIGIKTKDIRIVLKRLEKARKDQEQIIVYGDYDADGVTATAILWETLYEMGFQVMPFLPHREDHGYGLKPNGIQAAIDNLGKPDLLITVDNGIVAFEGADYCRKKGIDLIISDHHQSKAKLPSALAIIHSTNTSGSGVAYFLSKAIQQHFKKSNKDNFLELAAIGVVADMVPLIDVSRSLVKYGLKALTKTDRPGLRALITEAKLDLNQDLTTYHIGFILAPRLNATGRLKHCLNSLRLLCTRSQDKALRLASDLDRINRERQNLTFSAVTSVIEAVDNLNDQNKIIITYSKTYHPGVIGLIAGKLVEKFHKPAVAISIMGEHAKGSVRSIKGVNIIEILRIFEADFIDLGGHPLAAGFTIKINKLKQIKVKLEDYFINHIDDKWLIPIIEIETEIKLSDINYKLYQALECFAPFGLGNPRPVFLTRNVKVASIYPLGKEQKHLKLFLSTANNPNVFEAVYFSIPSQALELKPGDIIDVVYNLDLNQWNGEVKLQLVVKDIR